MAEVILTHIFKKLKFETSTSPEISLFQRFRKIFPDLSRTPEELNFIDINAPHLITKQLPLLAKLKALRSKNFARDDYKEFLDLTILLLEGKMASYTFLTCGALHKARWMAKVIYAMKMILFKHEMDSKGLIVFEDGQYEKLVRFVLFVLFTYVEYWFETPLASKATKNDLDMVKNCIRYRVVDSLVSEGAVHACHLQGWYLSPELAPLCLFDANVPLSEKREIVAKLRQFVPRNIIMPEKRFGAAFGRPEFSEINFSTELVDVIDRDSAFFSLLSTSAQVSCGSQLNIGHIFNVTLMVWSNL